MSIVNNTIIDIIYIQSRFDSIFRKNSYLDKMFNAQLWQNMDMRVVVTKTIKNIVKMQYKDNALYVTANIFVTRNRIKRLIEENIDWIHAKRATEKTDDSNSKKDVSEAISSVCDRPFEQQQLIKDIFAGRKTMILGDVISVESGASSKTYLDGSVLYISEKNYDERELRIKAIKAYLKKIAFLFVANEISSFGTSVSLCPQKIEFKDIVDCWCKCSLAAQKILCFDYRITQLPQNLRYYVIAHAFAHFKFSAHDDGFWNYISNIVPHYADFDKQLESYDFLKDL